MFAGMTLLLAVTAEAAEKAAKSGGLPQLNPELLHATALLAGGDVHRTAFHHAENRIAAGRRGD